MTNNRTRRNEIATDVAAIRRLLSRSYAIRHPILSVAIGVVLGMFFAVAMVAVAFASLVGLAGDAVRAL